PGIPNTASPVLTISTGAPTVDSSGVVSKDTVGQIIGNNVQYKISWLSTVMTDGAAIWQMGLFGTTNSVFKTATTLTTSGLTIGTNRDIQFAREALSTSPSEVEITGPFLVERLAQPIVFVSDSICFTAIGAGVWTAGGDPTGITVGNGVITIPNQFGQVINLGIDRLTNGTFEVKLEGGAPATDIVINLGGGPDAIMLASGDGTINATVIAATGSGDELRFTNNSVGSNLLIGPVRITEV
ncbi:unnamed protein product, partial [marine sediment metagenome]